MGKSKDNDSKGYKDYALIALAGFILLPVVQDSLIGRLERQDSSYQNIDSRVTQVEMSITALETKLPNIENDLKKIINSQEKIVDNLFTASSGAQLERDIEMLEDKIDVLKDTVSQNKINTEQNMNITNKNKIDLDAENLRQWKRLNQIEDDMLRLKDLYARVLDDKLKSSNDSPDININN